MSFAVGNFLLFLLDVCFWVVIIQVVLSWLIAFEVVNVRNQQAANFIQLIDKITAPVYTPLRKVIPPIAGIDITPVIVLFAISLLQGLVKQVFFTYSVAG